MAYDLDTYRSWFPHIQTGKIWLNHAAISPVSKRVSHAITHHLNNRSFGDIDVYPSVIAACERTKKNLAALINTTPDRIGFVLNTSDGLSILANGLDWKTGDRILLNDIEFPANGVPFLNLKNLGVEIDYVKSTNGEISIEEIERAITPRTKLLSISFVQFLSGFKADLTSIGDVCKRHGIIFCVDSIQGLGAAPLDVQESKIDFLSNGGNKWLMGLMGTGFVFVTAELQERIRQKQMGWTSNKNFFGDFFQYRIDLDETARRYENGTQNYIGITALKESTATLLEVGIDNVHEHLLMLTDQIISFCDGNGFELASPRDRTKRAGIISIKHPDVKTIFDDLNEQRIVVSLREGILRIAPHFYNSEEDLHALFSILHYYSKVTQ
ncbi:MAG: aminotransferase class V-fold PLP-dependent enzyme [Ignavibacteriales bacterium]|nr:aminotransferase class V-fold PLP-dependent enzyme [Ignavibacteriales bacterium]